MQRLVDAAYEPSAGLRHGLFVSSNETWIVIINAEWVLCKLDSKAQAEIRSTISDFPAANCRERRIGSSRLDSNDKISCCGVLGVTSTRRSARPTRLDRRPTAQGRALSVRHCARNRAISKCRLSSV